MQYPFWDVHDDYCFHCLSSLIMPSSVVLLDSSYCLLSKTFFVLLTDWLIRVLTFHSNISVVPILGYPRWLLLLFFIKLDNALKCGVVWFIMKELNKSFISWILSITVLWLVMCVLLILIKRFSSVILVLDC